MQFTLRRWSVLTAVVALAALLLMPSMPTSAAPVSCTSFLQPYVAWAQSSPPFGIPYVQFELTSISKDGPVSYAKSGALQYVPATKFAAAVLSTRAGFPAHDARQYFSDRFYSGSVQLEPFDPQQTDTLGLIINAQSGAMTLRLASWGDAPVTITPVCENGLMYGFGNTPNLQHLYVIRLVKDTAFPRG